VTFSLLLACTDAGLERIIETEVPEVIEVEMNACTTPGDSALGRLKFILVVDESGSNQQRYSLEDQTPLPGSDRTGERRYGALLRFLRAYPADSRVYFSLIRLGSNATLVQDFTNDRPGFINTVLQRKNDIEYHDYGDTNYDDALRLISTLITDDVEAAEAAPEHRSSSYVIIWVSDGAPVVNAVLQNFDGLLNFLNSIVILKQDSPNYIDAIVVNTAYYFSPPADAEAILLMREMADIGGGMFFQFGLGEEIDVGDFSIPSRVASYALREVWVTNTQLTWREGRLVRDTDGDGLADEVENQGPSDPELADTDGNGVSDAVEFAISGQTSPCHDANCSPDDAEPYTLCRPYAVPGAPPGTYADKDGDLLNDCEEELLGSDPRNPDTNFDYVPDFFAFRSGVSLTERTYLGHLDSDMDGVTDYQELKDGTPIDFDNALLHDVNKVLYFEEEAPSSATEQCYRYVIEKLPYEQDTDVVRAYLMEAPRLQVQLRLMRMAERPLGKGVTLENSDFGL